MLEPLSNVLIAARGAIDFLIHPEWASGFGGPFNGQTGRQRLFDELIRRFDFSIIIETGTFRGTTTEFMSKQARIPVYSAELDIRPFTFAFLRLFRDRRVHVFRKDSRAFIEALGKKESLRSAKPFAYLDAHWNVDFPLGEEVNLIFGNWPASVVMIDDFQVPDDLGYGFDAYGPESTISTAYLENCSRFPVTPFFPSLPSAQEDGSRRGCVILARDEDAVAALRRCALLRAGTPIGRPAAV